MPRLHIPILALVLAAALPAAEGKGNHHLGAVLARQVVDAGHILEVRAVPGASGEVLVRWGDIDRTVAKGASERFDWSGGATGTQVALVRTLAFEDGAKTEKKEGKQVADRVVDGGSGGSVTWQARTGSACDGVVLQAKPGSALQVTAGPASLSVTMP